VAKSLAVFTWVKVCSFNILKPYVAAILLAVWSNNTVIIRIRNFKNNNRSIYNAHSVS